MNKKKRRIPFGWLPGHWGLAGKTRDLAEAEYTLEGEKLERRRLEINPSDKNKNERTIAALELDLKYEHIDEEEFDRAIVELNLDKLNDKELQIEFLKVDKKHGKISDAEFEKKEKTIKEEPYVRVAKVETDPTNPAFGGLILDWNESFVIHLEENGYGPHPTPEETVNEWVNELCKNIALEAFDGLGDFTEKMNDYNYHRPKRKSTVSEDVIYPEDLKGDNSGGDSKDNE